MYKAKSKIKLFSLLFVSTFFFAIFISIFLISCTKDPVNPIDGDTSNLPERNIKDTAYGTDPKQKMDVFLPAGRTSATKVVLFMHGGGWESGSKSDSEYLQVFNLIKLKWPQAAVVSINYRLTSNPTIHYSEIMSDVSSAVNFMVNNKNSFVTSDEFAMMGASAGAHLALLYTYKHNTNNHVKCVADFFGPTKLSDWDWYSSYNFWLGRAVKDILIQYNGVPWEVALYESNSPLSVATAQSKPTIIFHGTLDAIVPIYQSQWLKGRLTTLGVVNEYYEYFDGHGFNYTNSADAMDKSIAFFKKHLN